MSEDALKFLDGQTEAADETVEQPKPVTTEIPAPVVKPAAEQSAASEVPEATDTTEGVRSVPLATFLDVRDKLKDAEKRLKAAEPENDVQIDVPDPVKQPQEYAQYMYNTAQFTIMNDRMNTSEKFAVREHGAELVNAARDWALEQFQVNEDFARRVMGSPDPYETAIAAYNESQIVSEFKDPAKLKAYKDWLATQENGGVPPAAEVLKPQPQEPAKPKPQVPKSIATAPGAGGAQKVAVGEGVAFDGVFKP